MYKKIVLDNGLTIILAEMPSMESISIGIWISAGGRYEKKEQAGVSHFLEHMAFKGTKKRSAREIKESIEGIGGLLNAFTGEEFTCYLAKVLARDAAVALNVLNDMVLNPRLAAEDFVKERDVILEEIKMYIDMPNHYVHELLVELLWPDQPLGMPLAGTHKTVSSLNRKDLVNYRERLYNPKNMVVSVAGKFPSFDLRKGIVKSFKHAGRTAKQTFAPVVMKQKEPVSNFSFRNTEQTHMALGIHGYSRFSADRYSLDLLHIILGGNMSSRLFQELREKSGLAYEISSSVKHYHDTGALVISAGIDNRKVSKAVRLILEVLRQMKAKKVGKEEFRRAKEFYRGQLLMIFEDTMSHMLWLGEKFTCADLEYKAADIIKRLDKVTIDDIQKTSRGVLKNNALCLATVGPTPRKVEKEIKTMLRDL